MKYIKLKKIATYPTGKLNSNAAEKDGIYPFFTCSHDIYRINNYAYDGEYVLLGGNNATGDFPIFYYNGKFNAYQRTYLIQPIDTNQFDTRYLFYSIGLKLKLMQSNAAGTATRFLTQPILDNINIEYDGGGHRLNVKFGKLTNEEFDELQNKRDNFLIDNGFKIIRIVCTNDKIPSDDIIIEQLNKAFLELRNTDFLIINW